MHNVQQSSVVSTIDRRNSHSIFPGFGWSGSSVRSSEALVNSDGSTKASR